MTILLADLQVSLSAMTGTWSGSAAESAVGSYSGNLYLYFASSMKTTIAMDTTAQIRQKA